MLFAGIGALFTLVAISSWIAAAAVRRSARALDAAIASASDARARQAGLAALFGQPPMERRLAELRGHLPPGLAIVAAARTAAGPLAITLDTPDPDALRQAIRADPWFERFRERGQSIGGRGSVRVTLEGTG